MRFSFASLFVGASLVGFGFASPVEFSGKDKRSFVVEEGVKYTVFEHAATGSTLKFVTNSGICETTPGVNQYSGYLTVGTGMNMWFWFFESRNSPATAPLATWFNGGPGCSSMIGLFQENGPCQFYNGASTPSLNPYSFNEYANMLYIDQPIGVGFSYGTDSVSSTVTAAPYVWNLIQAFYTAFPVYENRDFGIFTESYGGHYGPEFAYYFESQNTAIANKKITGIPIDLIALGVNNGWFDPIIQYKAYVDYSYNNTYKSLITASQRTSYLNTYTQSCVPGLQSCYSGGSNSACEDADSTCYNDIEGPLSSIGDFDVYDIREPSNDAYPPETYVTYLQSAAVVKAIGAKSTYQECPDAPGQKFSATGDGKLKDFPPQLNSVVSSGIRVLLWAGDADWICNWFGGLAVANAITWANTNAFANLAVKSYTVGGVASGTYKTLSNLSWLRVFGAGHEVPYYQPAVALQAFKQTMSKQPLSST